MKNDALSTRTVIYFLFFLSMPLSPVIAAEKTIVTPIYVDQLGYLPASPKIALVSSSTGVNFELVDVNTKKPVLQGMLQLAEAHDSVSSSDIWAANFSVIQATGVYELKVPGIGSSFPFRIEPRLYTDLARQAIHVFYYHRSGIALAKPFAGEWPRPASQVSDGLIFSATEGDATPRHAVGGWFDGSDYGKYVPSGVFAAGTLLLLAEQFPHAFPDGSFNIPERANGIPDILDEIRWELEFLFLMQNEDGSVNHKLTPMDPSATILPEKDERPRYIFPSSSAATAGTCALLAKASRLYSPYDATFATQCLAHAQKAWHYLETHPSDGGFENPPNVRTKTFHDSDDSDERFWAALELYLATHDAGYQTTALEIKNKRIPFLPASGYWGNVMPLAIGSILHATPEILDAGLRQTAISDLKSLAQIQLEAIHQDGFHLSLKKGEFTWGSNGMLMQNAMILCLADMNEPKPVYRQGAVDQLHAVLGRNPLSMCYVTGMGSNSPKHPYHLICMADKVEKPIPGLLVCGPDQFMGDAPLKKEFTENTAPATTYIDSEESISSNETDLTSNAVLAFVAAYLSF